MSDLKFISNIDTICILLDIENYEEIAQDTLELLEIEKEKTKKQLISNSLYKNYIKVGNMNFEILSVGTKGYSYILQNSAYKIYVSKYLPKLRAFAPIQIRISSEYLWSAGINETWSIIYNWVVENFGNVIREKVCRLDLCTHVSNIEFTTNFENTYKGQYKKCQIFRTNDKINAITFGSRQNKNIYCRIYNKTLEIQEKKHKNWFYDIWKNNNMSTDNVWNIEFEIKSEFLNKFNIITVNDVLLHIKDLWEFCTTKWLIKIDNTNTRKERCKTNSDWEKIQNAFFYLPNTGLIARNKQLNMDADILIPTIAGFIISYATKKQLKTLEETINKIGNEMIKYLDNKSTSFRYEINKKSLSLNSLGGVINE